jgi:hypothetical protein
MKANTASGTGPRKAANHIHNFADLSRRTAIRPARGTHISKAKTSTGNAIADMHALPKFDLGFQQYSTITPSRFPQR